MAQVKLHSEISIVIEVGIANNEYNWSPIKFFWNPLLQSFKIIIAYVAKERCSANDWPFVWLQAGDTVGGIGLCDLHLTLAVLCVFQLNIAANWIPLKSASGLEQVNTRLARGLGMED